MLLLVHHSGTIRLENDVTLSAIQKFAFIVASIIPTMVVNFFWSNILGPIHLWWITTDASQSQHPECKLLMPILHHVTQQSIGIVDRSLVFLHN